MGWPIPADEENPWRKITYMLEEEAVPGYTCEYRVAQDGFHVTNIHVPESFDIPVAKHWEDSANKYKYRPKPITVRLLANGEEVGDMVLTQKEKWRGVFKDEPVYAQGKPIEYTIVEDEVNRYRTEITGSAREGFTISNSLSYGYDFRGVSAFDEDRENPWEAGMDERIAKPFSRASRRRSLANICAIDGRHPHARRTGKGKSNMATKRYDGIMKRLAACTLGALLVLTALCPAALAQVQEQKTVRVGWFENHFNITGANGERSGFGYEYQQAVSAYTGWSYEYVERD